MRIYWHIVVKVWLISAKSPEKRLRDIHRDIVSAAVHTDGIPVHDETDMMTLFPGDLMQYGSDEELHCEVHSRNVNIPDTALVQLGAKIAEVVSLHTAARFVDYDAYDHTGRRILRH